MTTSQDLLESSGHKLVTIFVNGHEETIEKGKLTYEEVVALAYPNPNYDENTYKAGYFRKSGQQEKSLNKGESVEITEGIAFTVIRAVRS